MGDSRFTASIDQLMQNFRSALVALVPFADQARVAWSDTDQYDDWERIADALFRSFVASPIAFDRARQDGDFPLVRYDRDLESYAEKSWIAANQADAPDLAFVRFLSRHEPFDTVEFAETDSASGNKVALTMRWSESSFALSRRRADGTVEVVRTVETDG